MNVVPDTQDTSTLEQRFQGLLQRWRDETALLSSSTALTAHQAYQDMIALGQPVLPLLFRELEGSHDGHLSAALAALTGVSPVAPEDRGRIREVAEAWLRWGRENGFSW